MSRITTPSFFSPARYFHTLGAVYNTHSYAYHVSVSLSENSYNQGRFSFACDSGVGLKDDTTGLTL